MNVSFMKEFITFVKTLNYTKAANELFLSQPTLRAHIRAIECELGGPLVAKRDGSYAHPHGTPVLEESPRHRGGLRRNA